MSTELRHSPDLIATLGRPHDLAFGALDDDAPLAIAWTSAHLAAVDSVLYSAVRRRVPSVRRRLREIRAVDRELQRVLCRLDRRLTGDHHLVDEPVEDFVEEVRDWLSTHVDVERGVLDALLDVLPNDEQEALADRLQAAMATGPTRPHPHTPHTALSALVARMDAGVDRARDAMDNRVVDTGRPVRVTRTPERWGCYLMGTPYPQRDREEQG